MSLSKEIQDFIDSKLKENGFELVDLDYRKEGGRWILRVFMDKLISPEETSPEVKEGILKSGVTLEDCERMSETLGRWLDTTSFFMTPYVLEISSPGINRTLKREDQFLKFIGQNVKVSLYAPLSLESKQKNFAGKLVDCKNHSISVEDATSGLAQIPIESIAKAHLNII